MNEDLSGFEIKQTALDFAVRIIGPACQTPGETLVETARASIRQTSFLLYNKVDSRL